MKLATWILFLFLVLQPIKVWADGWNFPSETWGISFGNSKQFTGLRFNWIDKDVKQVNGWNFTMYAPPNKESGFDGEFNGLNMGGLWGPVGKRLNGLNLGLFAGPFGEQLNGVNIGLIGPFGKRLNGITMGLIPIADELNGITLGGGVSFKNHLRGFATSFAYLSGRSEESVIDGVALAGVGVGAKRLNGIAAALFGTYFNEVKGVTLGGFNLSDSVTGVQMGGFNNNKLVTGAQIGLWNHMSQMTGLQFGLINMGSIANPNGDVKGVVLGVVNHNKSVTGIQVGLLNMTDNLNGLQLGLINWAGNNPVPFKILPLFNACLSF